MKRPRPFKSLGFPGLTAAYVTMACIAGYCQAPQDGATAAARETPSLAAQAATDIAQSAGVSNHYSRIADYINPNHKRIAELRSASVSYQVVDVRSRTIGAEAVFKYLEAKDSLKDMLENLRLLQARRREVRADFERLAAVPGFLEIKMDRLPPSLAESTLENDIAEKRAWLEALRAILLGGDWASVDKKGRLIFKVRPSKDYVVVIFVNDPVKRDERVDDALILRD